MNTFIGQTIIFVCSITLHNTFHGTILRKNIGLLIMQQNKKHDAKFAFENRAATENMVKNE